MRFFKFFTTVLILTILESCSTDPYKVDTSKVNLKLEFINLDSIVNFSNKQKLISSKTELIRNHREILDFSFGYCLGIPLQPDSAFLRKVNEFKSDAYIKRLEKTISKFQKEVFKTEITDGFKRLKYHFPDREVPNSIFFINSLFSASVFCTEKEVAIGLDRYLGANARVIKELPSQQFYEWIKVGMEPRYLTRDVLAAWLMTNYLEETNENYAAEMIRWGKILFLCKVLLPEEKEEIVLRYTAAQLEWANASEKAVWSYLVDKELLFKTDEETRINLLKEGPYSIGLPKESPDRIGQFMGYKIVKQFMEEEEISLEKLVAMPYNELLQKYKVK
jgi:hypothetical protein